MKDIRPIHDEKDYEAALRQLDVVFDANPGTPEGDRLEVLSVLIEAYENERHPIPAADPIETIAFHMEQNNLTSTKLPLPANRVSEILSGKREVSKEQAKSLGEFFHVSPALFI